MFPAQLTVMTLNCWRGSAVEPLLGFLAREGDATDVFCLQEVYNTTREQLEARHPGEGLTPDLLRRIALALPDHRGVFAGYHDDPGRMGLAMFVRHSVPALHYGQQLVYEPCPTDPCAPPCRMLQFATLGDSERWLTVANYHGIFASGGKGDSPERLRASAEIRAVLGGGSAFRAMLCGDFNLSPSTESFRILAEGWQDPVAERGMRGTRTELYRHYGDPAHCQHADYVLLTPDVPIVAFEVLPDRVSDHCPLRVTVRYE